MSTVARKAGDRVENLRKRAMDGVSEWEDELNDPNSIFVPVEQGVEDFLDRMDSIIDKQRLQKLEHRLQNGGVLVKFRRRRDVLEFQKSIGL